MLPITKFVIYHESKTGPFLKKNDSVSIYGKKLTNNKSQINRIKQKVFNSII